MVGIYKITNNVNGKVYIGQRGLPKEHAGQSYDKNAYYRNDKGYIEYNELCEACNETCKQSYRSVIMLCPKLEGKVCTNQPQHFS